MKIPIFGEKECFPNIPEIFLPKIGQKWAIIFRELVFWEKAAQ